MNNQLPVIDGVTYDRWNYTVTINVNIVTQEQANQAIQAMRDHMQQRTRGSLLDPHSSLFAEGLLLTIDSMAMFTDDIALKPPRNQPFYRQFEKKRRAK